MEQNTDKLYLDKAGHEMFIKEIEILEQKLKEHQMSKGEAYSSSAGDGWHDNFEFEENVRVERMLLGQLREKTEKLKNVVIISEQYTDDQVVDINDVIKLTLTFGENDFETDIYKLVATATPEESIDYISISVNSPIGSVIYGKKIGDITSYTVNQNKFGVKIEEKIQFKEKSESKLKK